jgi:hypothetical protein
LVSFPEDPAAVQKTVQSDISSFNKELNTGANVLKTLLSITIFGLLYISMIY